MYAFLLLTHSWVRWIVLICFVFALMASFASWLLHARRTKTQQLSGVALVVSMDVQLLLGLILYFGVSPVVQAALGMGSSMMKDRVMRFWGMEHMVAMILAVAVLHAGRMIAKKSQSDISFCRRLAVTTLLSCVFVFPLDKQLCSV
jgi:hypothetical protein